MLAHTQPPNLYDRPLAVAEINAGVAEIVEEAVIERRKTPNLVRCGAINEGFNSACKYSRTAGATSGWGGNSEFGW